MVINFVVNPVFSGWSPEDDRLGGTEESVVEWSKELTRRGHKVVVYGNVPNHDFDGIPYRTYDHYEPGDRAINVKYHGFQTVEPTWYLTNETDVRELNLDRYKGVILPSKWALDHLEANHNRIRVVPHGFSRLDIYPEEKIENQCLYSSSPDRGLSELQRMWHEVVEQVPNAQLIVTYNGIIDAPNAICLGDVDEETMNHLYRTSDFWLHPCLGGELFCMAAVKAQVAKTIPVVYPTMALQETVRNGIKTDKENFVKDLVSIMGNKHKQGWIRTKMEYEPFADWEESTRILERVLSEK